MCRQALQLLTCRINLQNPDCLVSADSYIDFVAGWQEYFLPCAFHPQLNLKTPNVMLPRRRGPTHRLRAGLE